MESRAIGTSAKAGAARKPRPSTAVLGCIETRFFCFCLIPFSKKEKHLYYLSMSEKLIQKQLAGMPDYESDDVRELNMTNSEWLRYRATRELPKRADKLIAARLKSQYEDQPKTKESPSFIPDLNEKPTQDFNKYKGELILFFRSILLGLKESKGLNDGVAENFLESASEEMRKLEKFFYKNFYFKANEDEGFKEVEMAILNFRDRVNEIIGHDFLPPKVKAILIEIMFFADSISKAQDASHAEWINHIVNNRDYIAISELLKRDVCVGIKTFMALNNRGIINDIKERKIDIILPVVSGLTELTKKEYEKHGLQMPMNEDYFLSDLVNELKSRSVLDRNQACVDNLQRVADNYFQSLNNKTDTINQSNPSHARACVIIETLIALYRPWGDINFKIPKDMVNFLKKIYCHKVAPFSTSGARNFLHEWVRKLAEIAGLDFEEIIKL